MATTEIYTDLHTLSLHYALPICNLQACVVEILRYAFRDEDRFGIPADPDELAVGKCVGNKILGGGIARHQRCALGGDKDHHCIEQDRGAAVDLMLRGYRRAEIGRASCRERVCQYV